MKKIFYLFIFELLALPFVSCQQRSNNPVSSVVDSVAVEPVSMGKTEIVDAFFKDFQEKNDGWTKTEAGHKKLAEAFKKKITSDIDFAKACATYNTEYQYTDNPITRSESISPYSKDDGEEGEIKAFDFVIKVKLLKPLYNGQKEISVKYEIINTIPSTIEEHWRPYVEQANFCDVFNPFLKSNYDATLNLGCYIITKKDK